MGFSDLVAYGQQPKVEKYDWMNKKTFTLVDSLEKFKEIIDRAIEAGLCALDLETEGLDSRIDHVGKTQHKIVGYCLCFDGEEGFYVPVGHKKKEGKNKTRHPSNLNRKSAAEEIARLCENCVTIYHNARFDHEFLFGSEAKIEMDRVDMFEDTLILDYLRDSTAKRHGLKYLSKEFLGMEMISLKQLFLDGVKDKDFSTLDPTDENTVLYAGSDAICTYLLFKFFTTHAYNKKDPGNPVQVHNPEKNIEKTIYGEQEGTYRIEKALVPAHRWMERNRPKVDIFYVKSLKEEVEKMIDDSIKDIEEAFVDGIREKNDATKRIFSNVEEFQSSYDVKSPKQLGEAMQLLKERNPSFSKVEFEETEKSGQIRTNMAAIEKLAEDYGDHFPFIAKIKKFRSLQKVLGTYIKPIYENSDWDGNDYHPGRVNIKDDTIRFQFNPNRVDTGRYAASKGKPGHGYSGINVQSAPACYNSAKLDVKKIHSRPDRPGEKDAPLIDSYTQAVRKTDFLKRVEDNHFIVDNRTEDEYCIRKGCESCPFIEECSHDEPIKKKFYSVEAAVRPSIVAREGCVLVAIDYAGLELRVAANISKEPKWLKEFEEGEGDLHKLTAQLVYGDDIVNLPQSEFKQLRQKGKCVTGDTLVQTDQGLMPIKELDPGSSPDEFVEFEEPVEVWTDDGIHKATQFYNGGVQDTLKIETRGRYHLEGTETHRIRVYDKKEGYSWKHLKDIETGDYVIIDRGSPLHEDKPYRIDWNPFKYSKNISSYNSSKLPISKDWAYFMGMYTGDGSTDGDSMRITYDTREKEWENKFGLLLDRLGLDPTFKETPSKENTSVISIHSRDLFRFFDKCGVKKLSTEARVPHVVLKSGISSQKSFLRGLFDADGTINKDGDVELYSSSKELLEDVQTLLASMGILGNIRIKQSDHPLTGKTYYALCMGGVEAVKYGEKIGFDIPHKKKRIKEKAENRDKIPFPDTIVPDNTNVKASLKRTREREGLTYNMIDRHEDTFEFPEEVMWLRDRDVRILPVKKITKGREKVYDLTVPGPNSFWANGFINHNSANFSVVYGGGGGAVARATGVDSSEGWEIRNKMMKGLPVFAGWMKDVIKKAHKEKEVATAIGRKVRLKDINSSEDWIRAKQERNSVNSIVQGTATGDLIKYTMGSIYRKVKERGWQDICTMMLTIHDELVFEIRQDKLDEVLPEIEASMVEFAPRLGWPVPLEIDIELSKDWSPRYDWGKIHTIDPETGIAEQNTPRYLKSCIEMSDGMWYKSEDGSKKVWNGTNFVSYEEYSPEKSKEAAMKLETAEQEKSQANNENSPEKRYESENHNQNAKKPEKAKKAVTPSLPIYMHKVPIPFTNRNSTISYVTRLRRVKDACAALRELNRMKPSHVLCVEDVQGDKLVKPEDKVLVDPEIFDLLAFYEGI